MKALKPTALAVLATLALTVSATSHAADATRNTTIKSATNNDIRAWLVMPKDVKVTVVASGKSEHQNPAEVEQVQFAYLPNGCSLKSFKFTKAYFDTNSADHISRKAGDVLVRSGTGFGIMSYSNIKADDGKMVFSLELANADSSRSLVCYSAILNENSTMGDLAKVTGGLIQLSQ